MADLFLLDMVAGDQGNRVPAELPLTARVRNELESALRSAGLVVVSLNAVFNEDSSLNEVNRRRLRTAVIGVVGDAVNAELGRLRGAVTVDSEDLLDETFWGKAPDSEAVWHAAFRDLIGQFAHRRELTERGITRNEAAELLGVAAQSITSRLQAGKLVGMKIGREWRLPRWQFDSNNPTRVLADLDVLRAAFPGGPVSLSRWMMRPRPEFDGRTPAEEMDVHGSVPVIAFARALTAAAR